MRQITKQYNWARRLPIVFSIIMAIFSNHNVLSADNLKQTMTDKEQQHHEMQLKHTIEAFLAALGNDETDKVSSMFLPHASVGFFRKADGKESVKTMSIEQYIAQRKNKKNKKFTEPVQSYEINLSQGKLAFVRANATIYHDDIPSHHTQDFFVLMNVDGSWRFLSASYTSSPLESLSL